MVIKSGINFRRRSFECVAKGHFLFLCQIIITLHMITATAKKTELEEENRRFQGCINYLKINIHISVPRHTPFSGVIYFHTLRNDFFWVRKSMSECRALLDCQDICTLFRRFPLNSYVSLGLMGIVWVMLQVASTYL